jgi:cytochrome c-type protein NapC/trimethylamine-N-oxide reductase cytochrome c-type subunit TorC
MLSSRKRLRRPLRPVFWTLFGLVISFPIFSMTYYTMVRTSTPGFCSLCHEIQPAYDAWRSSTHANNGQGIVADCMDCHLPAPHDTYNFFFAKTVHGIKDVFAHFTGGDATYDRAVMRERAYDDLKNEQCQKCHRNIVNIPNKRGAMLAHRAVLYPRPGYEKKCTDCHRNLVHVDRPQIAYKQYAASRRTNGL